MARLRNAEKAGNRHRGNPAKGSERSSCCALITRKREEETGGDRRRGGSEEAEEQWQAEKGTAVVVN